jgi:signal transduction histidine kinase
MTNNKMNFKFTSLKLTIFYVLIVMVISISFSFAIYQISYKEIGRGINLQEKLIKIHPEPDSSNNFQPIPFQDLEKVRLEQLESSNGHLKLNLIYFNLLILLLSSGTSYFLARRTLKPIEDMLDSQNRFTADASHELKTPLTAMKTEIEVGIRDKNMNLGNAKKLLESNLEEINKLESLSNALLKLAKYQEETKSEFVKLPIDEVITEAYEKVQSLANEKSIEFSADLKNVKIKGDKQSLVELFVILIENAIKYSPKKSKIFINIKEDKKNVEISIIDHGIGIKASDLSYIFNRFYRADNSRNKEIVTGYGLGLSIAKRIVELNDGIISVSSKIGRGSEFVVIFPKF